MMLTEIVIGYKKPVVNFFFWQGYWQPISLCDERQNKKAKNEDKEIQGPYPQYSTDKKILSVNDTSFFDFV